MRLLLTASHRARRHPARAAVAAAPPAPSAAAPDQPVAVPNAGFETAGAAALPSGWSLDGPAPAGAAVRRADDAATAARRRSSSARTRRRRSTVLSETVALRVGHVYRLSAWVRTRDAVSDPLARYPTAVPAAPDDGLVPVHEPLPRRRRHERLDARRDDSSSPPRPTDRVRLHLGLNGTATGRAWFDDVHARRGRRHHASVIPLETRPLGGPGLPLRRTAAGSSSTSRASRTRGAASSGRSSPTRSPTYIKKLSHPGATPKDPPGGWAQLRTMADALLLRRFDEEFLDEMKGIADGAAKAGAKVDGRQVDLLDVVTMNSVDRPRLRWRPPSR